MVAQGAAYSGSLDMLLWLRNTAGHDIMYNSRSHVLSWAGLRGSVHIAKWLLAEVCRCDDHILVLQEYIFTDVPTGI